MKLEEFLKQKPLILPKNWKSLGYSSYYNCVVKEGHNFLCSLEEQLDDSENYSDKKHTELGELSKEHLVAVSRDFYLMILKTLQCYLNEGSPHKAYNVLNEGLLKESNNAKCKPLVFYLEFNNLYPAHYRLRTKQGEVGLGDLFHVPFESRHNINSNRYSIPGYPTLYLSNSVYLAYKELGDPDYDDLYVSKFYHTKHFSPIETLLDMTNKPSLDTIEKEFKFLARWILTMSCSIKVTFPSSPFKPEYILPQILFQWVRNNVDIGSRKVIGVSYSSTKIVDNREGYYGYFYNTAIPIHSSSNKGYCDVLTKQFCLTKPISFYKALEIAEDISIQGQVKSVELNGASVKYVKTDFGKIEQSLSNIPHSELYYVNGTKYE